jgi:hypothetical protein
VDSGRPLRGAASIIPKADVADGRLACADTRDGVLGFSAAVASAHTAPAGRGDGEQD